jgi:hypothetical protein
MNSAQHLVDTVFAEVSTGSGSDRVSEITAMEAVHRFRLPGRYCSRY